MLLGVYEDELCMCDWKFRRMRKSIDKRLIDGLNATFLTEEHSLHNTIISQLEAYFTKDRKKFDLPLKFVGTSFQQSVWKALLNIPYGEKKSYLALAQNLENEKAVRAVASANGANAISIIVPCHRIIGSDNALVGYAGGLPAKKKLLALESDNHQLELF